MKESGLQRIIQYAKAHRHKKIWYKAVTCMAAVVVFITVYALILPAITMERELVCTIEGHEHTEECYASTEPAAEMQTVLTLSCTAEDIDADVVLHSHAEHCYDEAGELLCDFVEISNHAHDDSCYGVSEAVACQLEESEGHTHEETCYEVGIVCGQEESEGHKHDENCNGQSQICTLEEAEGHAHSEACYEERIVCGQEESDAHKHGDTCKEVLQICELEEIEGHTHEEACYEAGLVCDQEESEGHKHDENCNDQIQICTLEEAEGHAHSEACSLQSGPVLLCQQNELVIHEHSENCFDADNKLICELPVVVEHQHDESCFTEVPVEQKPGQVILSEEEQIQVNAAIATIDLLPNVPDVEVKLQELIAAKDTATFNTYVSSLVGETNTAANMYNALSDKQKTFVSNVQKVEELQTLLANASMPQDMLILSDDSAVISELSAAEAVILKAEKPIEEETTEPIEENMVPADSYVSDGDVVQYPFTVTTSTYREASFKEGRVKVEFVLPFAAEQAVFDLEAMTWLDQSEGYAPTISSETRLLNEQEVSCQVLTGYIHLLATEEQNVVIPGTFSEIITVNVIDVEHGSQIAVLISAAMEHNTWNEQCQLHEIIEKQTVATPSVRVQNPLTPEEQQAYYEAFKAEVDAFNAAEYASDEEKNAAKEALLQKMLESYQHGELSDVHYVELYYLLKDGIDLNAIAENSGGTNWLINEALGFYDHYGEKDSVDEHDLERAILKTSMKNNSLLSSVALMTPSKSTNTSDQQIDNVGGLNSADKVAVSKTIEGTGIENVFDITLQIMTQDVVNEVYNEPNMAVSIVVDLSNTMPTGDMTGEIPAYADLEANTNINRFDAAMYSIYQFLENFADNTNGVSTISVAGFNTHAHELIDSQPCTTDNWGDVFDTIYDKALAIITPAEEYADSHDRFTNIEAGLKMGYDMIKNAEQENKYIIFISDGFPTTYLKRKNNIDGYQGYDPYTSSGTKGADGVFYDYVTKYYCSYGTSYSDKAAIYAREMAESIKDKDIKIFSIGVDIGGQSIAGYERTGLSVIDRKNTTYEIGSATDKNAFKRWLGHSIGSGDGYYHDSDNLQQFEEAFDDIFEQIKELNAESARLDWIASDPMGSFGDAMGDSVEFLGFYNRNNQFVTEDLVGSSGQIGEVTEQYPNGNPHENTATFHEDTHTIEWDVKNSGYYAPGGQINNTTNYLMALKYRVRLLNEDSDFVEKQIYNTNDTTTLTYRTILVKDVNGEETKYISDPLELEFPIPQVHGYLGELSFQKIDSLGRDLAGAEFTLSHDDANCTICRGNGTAVAINPKTATSDAEGNVSFTGVPSGHKYSLVETKVPDGFAANGYTYNVEIAYDEVTVTVKDKDNNPVTWDNQITNFTYYELPETGGEGTTLYTIGGMALIAGAAVLMYKKRRKEASY